MNKHKVPTGIEELDKTLGGGLPKGRLTHIYGSSSVGKSTLVYRILANDPEYTCLINTEGCFDRVYAKRQGVDIDKLFIMDTASSSNIFTFLNTALDKNLFKTIVVDSIAGLAYKDIYSYLAKELPAFIKKLETKDTVVIFTNQVRSKGKGLKPAHGTQINALSSVVLDINGKHVIDGGFESIIEVVKNRYGMPLGEIKLKLGDA